MARIDPVNRALDAMLAAQQYSQSNSRSQKSAGGSINGAVDNAPKGAFLRPDGVDRIAKNVADLMLERIYDGSGRYKGLRSPNESADLSEIDLRR